MLHDFLKIHRQAILDRARSMIEKRVAPVATYTELANGIPLFVDQLVDALRLAHADTDVIVASATRHGHDLHRMGFTVTQVVHDYGDICQAVTGLAEDLGSVISIEEFRVLNKCLDDAIAGAVTEFARVRERATDRDHSAHLGELAHELRNKLGAAILAHTAIKSGAVGIGGSTGAVLERNLRGMRDLIDGSLAAVRIASGSQHPQETEVRYLVEEIEADASLEARERGVTFSVAPIEPGLIVHADRAILAAAVFNLLQNGFKFSRLGGHISLTVTASADHICFAVQDECGGLPDGDVDALFVPFKQRGTDRGGIGLGLSISRRGVEADGGQITAKDLPGRGCIFTINVPRRAAA